MRVRIRRFEKLRCYSSTNVGRLHDWKLESLTDRALARARYQGPSPPPAVLRASRDFLTPVPTERHGDGVVFSTAATEQPEAADEPSGSSLINTWGRVSQKPK